MLKKLIVGALIALGIFTFTPSSEAHHYYNHGGCCDNYDDCCDNYGHCCR